MLAGRRGRDDAGFMFIEVLVAVIVLVVGLLAVFQLLISATHATATDRIRQAENSIARELVEDTRTLAYTQLTPSSIASALQSLVPGSTASGSTLTVTRTISPVASGYSFQASFTACSMDDPADGYGNYSQPPASGGSWCPDNAASGTTNPKPDDYKRLSVVVSPVGNRTTPTVQQTTLIYNHATHGPAVTCLSTSSTVCPGSNQTYTSGTSVTFYVTTSVPAASVEWLVNGALPSSSQLPAGAVDPYTPTSSQSPFTWVFPNADGTYTISALAFDANGNSGTKSMLQITLNRHQVIPPASVTAGWNQQISGVDIQWVPSIDQDVLYYNVYRQYGSNSAVKVCSAVTSTSCTDLTAPSPMPEPATCTSHQSYTTADNYWVVGVDRDPTTGQPRESTSQSTPVDADLCDHPPSAPTNLSGTLSGNQMTLTWSAPASPVDPDSGDTIQFWRIYRWTGTGPNFPGSRLDFVGSLNGSGQPVTTYTDPNADPGGVQQSYCVTAVDQSLDESPCSNVVTG
jgi:Tfp pilus assembly protein PilV